MALADRFLAGVIPREAWPRFELVLWRTLRGNLLSHHDDIDELIMDMNTVRRSLAGPAPAQTRSGALTRIPPAAPLHLGRPNQGELVAKCVFIVFAQGSTTRAKIRKLCEAFGANLYPCPESAPARRELATQVSSRLYDLKNVRCPRRATCAGPPG